MQIDERFIKECLEITGKDTHFVGKNILAERYCKWHAEKRGGRLSLTNKDDKKLKAAFRERLKNKGVKSRELQCECGVMEIYYKIRFK